MKIFIEPKDGDTYKVIKCRGCNGSGEVFNPYFERCRHLEFVRQIQEGNPEFDIGKCEICPEEAKVDCKGEFMNCPSCDGEKFEIIKTGGDGDE